MTRSLVTIDLGAIRENARTLAAMQRPSELWAVVKADGYGHGAADVGRAALEGGATAICVATVGEAVPLREALPTSRIVVLGPTTADEVAVARRASRYCRARWYPTAPNPAICPVAIGAM